MPNTPFKYQRIISLTAALTETLFALGAGDRVVGVTDTCDYPDEVNELPHVSCWFEPDMEKLFSLKPDLVLGLETAHAGLEFTLESKGVPMILVNPSTMEESLDLMESLGVTLQTEEQARTCVENLRSRLALLDAQVNRIPFEKRPTVSRILDIEDDQLIVAGPMSFQYDVIARAGGRNVTGAIKEHYPKVSFQQFIEWNPEVIFFCGYDSGFVSWICADEKWRPLRAVRAGRVYQFDCALTCRTGPRIVDMTELLFKTLYED